MNKIAILLLFLFSYIYVAPLVLKLGKQSGVTMNLNCEDEPAKGKNEKPAGIDSDLDFTHTYLIVTYRLVVKIYPNSVIPQVPYLSYKEPPPDFI